MKTFLFYDIETSGLNPAFDQVLTFASIRTDLALNEIEKTTITICLRRDIVPSPKAFLTHGLTFHELEHGISEYKAAQQIHKILNHPDTISLGYNSLGFDDEFLRFLFYRNLLDPYTHQYSNGCSRMDILPITTVFKIFHPEILKWPVVDGKSSLKLELISRKNSFKISGKAHEAMSDVEAVIELAKNMFQKKNIWLYCLDFFNKSKDEVRINSIKEDFQVDKNQFKVCLMLSTAFGSDSNYMAPVIHIGQSIPYKNQTLWMRLDIEDIPYLNSEVDLKDTFVIRKRPADELIVLPSLERFWNKMSSSLQESVKNNMEKIQQKKQRFFEFIQYHQEYKYPFIPDLDPDAALYQDGFFSFQEKKESSLFHKSFKSLQSDYQTHEILDKIKSLRIRALASRILYRNFKNEKRQSTGIEHSLNLNKLRSSLKEDQIIGYKNDIKFNCRQGLQELKELEHEIVNPDKETKKMFYWIKDYIKNL
ncbi:MAG: exodeoxyribonuclease I [Deltaproteobacteria bacterium]|jgi:exodeoxyribonuclease-1|nr:exodeoxyribonuclease I [Deltaproteobacteria bacterium]